jgi:hypothetical protein
MQFQLTRQACTTGTHTDAAPVSAASTTAAKPSEPNHVTVENGVETYSTGASGQNASSSSSATAPIKMADLPPAEPEKEEEDDLSLPVPEGARCKRRACGAIWEGENVSRGDGEKSKCRYHPSGVSDLSISVEVILTTSRSFMRGQSTMRAAQNAKCSSLTSL